MTNFREAEFFQSTLNLYFVKNVSNVFEFTEHPHISYFNGDGNKGTDKIC